MFSEQDPSLGTPPPIEIGLTLAGHEWGPTSPPLATLDELCPAVPPCPTCPRCSDPALSLADLLDHLHIEPLSAKGQVYPGLPSRVTGMKIK